MYSILDIIINLSKKIPRSFCFIGRKNIPKEVHESSYYLEVDAERLTTLLLILSTIISIIIFIIALIFFNNIIFSIMISISFFYLNFFILTNMISSKILEEKYEIESYGSQVIEDMYFGIKYTSFQDALKTIVRMNYPKISEKMKRILFKIINGEEIEEAFKKGIEKIPSETFKKGIIGILYSKNISNDVINDFVLLPNIELKSVYKEISSQLEIRITIFLAYSLFSPIILAMSLILFKISIFFFYIYIPFHTLILTIAYRYAIYNKVVKIL
ncbi:MAG: hypothetical protein QXF09_02035 [Nitrososphaerota archaeon]